MSITFKEYLKEAPIGDYQTIGNWDKNSSFRDSRDRMLIRNPSSIERVKKKFGNTPYVFNFYFVNSKQANRVTEEGVVSLKFVRENLGDEVANIVEKNLGNDNINVIFTNNKGAERKNMTAWIMAHRIGHALARERNIRDWFEVLNELIAQYLTTGKIKFNKAPKKFSANRKNYFLNNEDEANELIDMLARDMEYLIDDILSSVQNSILVM